MFSLIARRPDRRNTANNRRSFYYLSVVPTEARRNSTLLSLGMLANNRIGAWLDMNGVTPLGEKQRQQDMNVVYSSSAAAATRHTLRY